VVKMQKPKLDSDLERRAANALIDQGYKIEDASTADALPFSLPGYRPDLIAVRGNETLVVEVKSSLKRTPIDRLKEIAAIVSKHPGYRFVLLTPREAGAMEIPSLPTWEEIWSRVVSAERSTESDSPDAGFISLWSALEAAMRRRSLDVHLPLEQLPTTALMRQLYSEGELSYEQFESLLRLVNIRNRTVHGYRVPEIAVGTTELARTVRQIVQDWSGAPESG